VPPETYFLKQLFQLLIMREEHAYVDDSWAIFAVFEIIYNPSQPFVDTAKIYYIFLSGS
jgi:hypothetical protein